MDTDVKLRMPEAARRIGVTTFEMYRLVEEGLVPHTREGEFRIPFVRLADLDAYKARTTPRR